MPGRRRSGGDWGARGDGELTSSKLRYRGAAAPAGEADLGDGVFAASTAPGLAVARAPPDVSENDVERKVANWAGGSPKAVAEVAFALTPPIARPPPADPCAPVDHRVVCCGDWCLGGGGVDRALVRRPSGGLACCF